MKDYPSSDDVELVPGTPGQPLFDSEAEYEAFRKRFEEAVGPELEKHAEARRRSEQDARWKLLGGQAA